MRVTKKIFLNTFCLTMLWVFNNAVVQAATNTTSTWDLVRQSLQEQSPPETAENNRISQSPDAQEQITEELSASERETLTITGQVVDYLARPVEGAEVAVTERKREYFYDEFLFSAKVIAPVVKTDKNGLFELQAHITSELPPQHEYYTTIVARKQGLAYAWDEIPQNYKDKTHCLLVLEKVCTFTGKVLDHNNKPIPGAKVQAIPKGGYLYRQRLAVVLEPKEWFTTETDSNGNFSFDSFNDEVNCDFYVKAPDLNCTYIFSNISSSDRFNGGDDIKLILPQEGKIQGRVVQAEINRPVGSVELLLQPVKNREDRLKYLPFTIVTNPDSSFVCDGLPEGENTIELSQQDSQEADWFAESVKLNVTPNQLNRNIELKVQKGGIIEYTVRHDDTKEPLPGIYVSTCNENVEWIRLITNHQGISRQRLPQGQYRAWASREGNYTWKNDEPIVVRDGDVTRVNIELPEPTTISGIVVNADGKPAEDILVEVHPFSEQVYTDKEGRFVAGYENRWADRGRGYLYVIARDTLRSHVGIVHTNNLSQPVKLSLSPALTVKGKIADPNEIGIPSARVSLIFHYAGCRSEMRAEALTDAGGLFELKAIPITQPDFDYRIRVNSVGFASIFAINNKITVQGETGDTVDLGTIELSPTNLTLSGTLFDANGLPKPHTFVSGGGKSTETDEQGRFFIKGVAQGPVGIQGDYGNAPGGAGFTTAQGGDQDIKVIIGQKLIHMSSNSLLGKPLPSIDQFNLSLDQELSQNKMVLLCFADIDQRPSRNTLLKLNEQAQKLLDRDLYMVFIQAVPVAEQKLVAWLKNNEIIPPVGMSKTSILELGSSYNWGVQSLPWLILTDKQHNVTAEGFSIDELNEKISSR